MKIRRLLLVFLFAFMLTAFDAEDAKNWLNGQWQGLTVPGRSGEGVRDKLIRC